MILSKCIYHLNLNFKLDHIPFGAGKNNLAGQNHCFLMKYNIVHYVALFAMWNQGAIL